MKLDKELVTTHAKRLQAILNEKSTFAPYIARPDFSKVLENSLNTLNAAEKKLTNVELAVKYSAKTLVKDFNKLGKNEFKLDDNFTFDDEADLVDNINYLVTYCKNIFKVNLDSLLEGKQVTASNPTIDLRDKTEDASANFGPMGGMVMGDMAYGNPFVMGQAYAKVKGDIASGKLYTYNSKPKSIIYAKWASIATIGLTALTLFIAAIFAILSAKLNVRYIKSGGEQYTDIMNFNAIGPGIMYILIGLFAMYPMFQLIRSVIGKNDNLKYYFNWPWVLIFILMVLIFVMPDMRITWLLSSETIKETPGTTAWNAFQIWKVMYLVVLGCAGLCLIPMIIGAVCNPKQNQALLEQKLKQYVDEAMSSAPTGFGPTASNASADIQKPVDVKKPTSKKPKSSKPKSESPDKK